MQINTGDASFYYILKESKYDQATTDDKEILRLRHADARHGRGPTHATAEGRELVRRNEPRRQILRDDARA